MTAARSALVFSALFLVCTLALQAQLPQHSTVAPERIDDIRDDLLNVATRAQQMTTSPSAKSDLAAVKRRVELAPDEELAVLYRQAGSYLAYFSEVVDQYAASVEEFRTGAQKSASFPEAPYPTGSRSATYGGIFDVGSLNVSGGSVIDVVDHIFNVLCSEGGSPQTERVSYQARFNAKQAILVAELIRDVLGRVCDQEFYALGAGGDASLACIVSDLVFQFARPLEEFPAICDALIDSAEIEGSYDRLGHLHVDLETTQASLDDLDNDLAAHDAALATHDDDIFNSLDASVVLITGTVDAAKVAILSSVEAHDSDIKLILSETRAFFLQTFVERSLRRELNGNASPPSTVYRLAGLYLPEEFGGNLERVRDVVAGTIADVTAAGEDANGAGALLLEGDQAIAAGSYKEAWDHYADAYLQAVRCPRSDPACR